MYRDKLRRFYLPVLFITLTASASPALAGETMCPASLGATLAVQEAGTAGGTPVVLVHGFPLDHTMWAAQVDALAQQSAARIITYDLRGFGNSHDPDAQYTMEILVDDLVAVLNCAKIDRAIIGGFSMGGYVALRAIERHPERFSGLILMDTQSDIDSQAVRVKRTAALRTVKKDGVAVFATQFASAALAPESASVTAAVVDTVSAAPERSISAAILALLSRTDTTEGLHQIGVPTLILVGEQDTITPPSVARHVHGLIPGAVVMLVPGAGHLSPMENPAVVSDAVVKFVAAVSP